MPSGSPGRCTGSSRSTSTTTSLRPAILWNDQRTAAECAEIEQPVGAEHLIELTGNAALTGFTAPKLLWIRRNEPEVYARIRADPPAEGLRPAALYGRARNRRERRIGNAAVRRCRAQVEHTRCSKRSSIPAAWLPPALESTELGGAGDQAAGALGVGIDAPGPLSVVLGTSGVVFAALERYPPAPKARCTRSATPSPQRGTRWE